MQIKILQISLLVGILFFSFGCGEDASISTNSVDTTSSGYPQHQNITVTTFWVGEEASSENANIPNLSSAWDDMWLVHFGGVDDPQNRDGELPSAFTPSENPFYFALPYNDFDANGVKKEDIGYDVYWSTQEDDPTQSICKNRWIKITKGTRVAYAQWQDVGPFGENDAAYVFGDALPSNTINNNAGLDVSPAVKEYLSLEDIDTVTWEFINDEDVPDGRWKDIITTTPTTWVDWYKPDTNTSWQWQLTGVLNTNYNVDLYDIDLFDTNETTIEQLHNDGRKVICYFSAGSYEDWRDDANRFPSDVLGNELDGWDGERWLDIRAQSVKDAMLLRLDLAKEKGCDGVEPDNVDGYTNNTGFALSSDDQLSYNKFIANSARERGLSVGLKNDLNQIQELEIFFDFALNEQCHIYDECDTLLPFIEQNKPVFNAEYDQKYVDNTLNARVDMCAQSLEDGFKTLVLPLNLDDSFRFVCE